MQGQGSALDEPARRSMEGAFGADFSSVRIHAGAESAELTQELGAEAFTAGNDIFFRDSAPDGSTKQGQSLLAHELTHTIQQGASASRTIRRKKADDVATLVSAKLNCAVRDDPTIKGHSMSFDLTLSIPGKAGVQKVKSIDAEVAHNVYGVTMEWWEEIVLDYDFEEKDPTAVQAKKAAGAGKSNKPWSDIYLSNPQSQTFYRWKNTVKAAQEGSLSGAHTTGVDDNPSMNLKADSYKRRTLRFRINATDALGASHKFDAIQVLVGDNGVLTSSVYEDSAGNNIVAGTGERELMRYSATIPLSVRQGDATNFTTQLQGKKKGVRKFVNTELTQVEQQAKTMGMAYFDKNRGNFYKELQQSNRLNGAPLIPVADQYMEFDASDGGLLVAQVSGKTVKRMFHTKNKIRKIPVNCNGNSVEMTVREFEQLPPEMFNIRR